MIDAELVLKTGEVFSGKVPNWATGNYFGEVVFNTGMVGYSEVITDPSYKGQIVCFTYPMIGNYGVEHTKYWESDTLHVTGIVVSQLESNHYRINSSYCIEDLCQKHNVAVITDVDTRCLAKTLSNYGVVSGAIITQREKKKNITYLDINKLNLVHEVSIKKPLTIGEGNKKIIAVDCGMKNSIWKSLCSYSNVQIKRVPYNYNYNSEKFDGIFFSNGPGNPENCQDTISILKELIDNDFSKPIFGICLGLQIIGLAIGMRVYKLKFGHRAQNHPCLLEGSKRVYLSSQNHGFALDEKSLPEDWKVWFRNLNDNSVQGIKHINLPYQAVQFHPEAKPGPTETKWLFDLFLKQL